MPLSNDPCPHCVTVSQLKHIHGEAKLSILAKESANHLEPTFLNRTLSPEVTLPRFRGRVVMCDCAGVQESLI